ncbi:hypothetical protein D187_003185 [Cystobacter fuscus DSM 2262]|uniref:TIR domain-containing protein n=1 Tax=Cystobacter fuscus (strain ATCC 25194 / DSM 2262 / NBRC 100088 / M29) TaxID=1242864 RepID=S9P814_CYSF2|nr:toll/interleukin-1 receptor domain-containing protein [Cystobacter fuscus]EPX59281.1 hypothetical protein D187_003185 [Cystobacter fuscus DSM 2262]
MARIFVSYRRDDSPGHTGRLYDHLVTHFGEKLVFRDIETIEPGADFVHAIEEAVESCGVLLAVIGPQWLGARDKQGRRRLDNPEDFVRLEVATALSRDVRVIPVLVGGATVPSEEELPPDLAPLARRNAIEISDPRFRSDMAHLIRAIQSALGEKPTPAAGVPRPGVQRRRWGAVGFVITFTVVVLAGLLWGPWRESKPTAGDAGVAGKVSREKKQRSPSPRDAGVVQPTREDAGTDAGVVQPTREDAGTDAGVVQPTQEDAGTDAGVVQPTQEDAGTDAGVVQPTQEDAGTDAGVVQPTQEDAGTDAGVVQPTQEDAGTDAGIATPSPSDAGTMDEDGGTGGSEVLPAPEPESSPQPAPEPESPPPPQPEPEPDSGP